MFNKQVIPLFDKFGPEFGTVTQDFLPFLIQNQYNENLIQALRGEKAEESSDNSDEQDDVDSYV